MNIALCIPTRNGAATSALLIEMLSCQSVRPSRIVVVDSDSSDGTPELWRAIGAEVVCIPVSSFNHGATRQLALSLCQDVEVVVYVTQDAILAGPDSIMNILKPLDNDKVGAVCGRQLPQPDASPIAAHARMFNYPTLSSVKSKDDIPSIGIKAAFLSNSFAAYRRTALMEVGGFPSDVIFGEDTFVAAKMLNAGWKVAYEADAICYHSHNYTMWEEFERYFDIGVFHSSEKWFIDLVGKATREGKKYVLSELQYLGLVNPLYIPSAVMRTGLKLIGYKLGLRRASMPLWLNKKLSMNKAYWKNE